jgi:hypothetical protein
VRLFHDRPGLGAWLLLTTTLGAIVVLSVRGPVAGPVWESPQALFGLVVVAASLCVIASAGVIAVGLRDRTAEIGIIGGSLLVLSTLALVHGLTVPGVLYGSNRAVTSASLLAPRGAHRCGTSPPGLERVGASGHAPLASMDSCLVRRRGGPFGAASRGP